MVDIHTHILPSLDDGAGTLEEALKMVSVAAKTGTTDLVATPHGNSRFAFHPQIVLEKLTELRNAVGQFPAIHTGCELHLTLESVQDALDHPTRYTINHRQYLLVELSNFSIPKTTTGILSMMLQAGMVPIIVHPELNPLLDRMIENMSEWCEMGCLVQVTAQSLSGDFGAKARNRVRRLLGLGIVHVVASDAHDTQRRPPLLDSARRAVAVEYGEAVAESLFTINPRAVISGDQVVGDPHPPRRRSRLSWDRFRAAVAGA
jgi:protein-tyrosine phosphatase